MEISKWSSAIELTTFSHVMTQNQKSFWLPDQTNWTLYQLRHHLLLSCMWPAVEGNRPLARNGCWSSQRESDSLKQTHDAHDAHDAHRIRAATQSLASRLFDCKHDFPGVTSLFEMGILLPTACHVLSIFESRIPSCLTTPSTTVIAEPKDFSAEGRLHLSGAGTCSILSALK